MRKLMFLCLSFLLVVGCASLDHTGLEKVSIDLNKDDRLKQSGLQEVFSKVDYWDINTAARRATIHTSDAFIKQDFSPVKRWSESIFQKECMDENDPCYACLDKETGKGYFGKGRMKVYKHSNGFVLSNEFEYCFYKKKTKRMFRSITSSYYTKKYDEYFGDKVKMFFVVNTDNQLGAYITDGFSRDLPGVLDINFVTVPQSLIKALNAFIGSQEEMEKSFEVLSDAYNLFGKGYDSHLDSAREYIQRVLSPSNLPEVKSLNLSDPLPLGFESSIFNLMYSGVCTVANKYNQFIKPDKDICKYYPSYCPVPEGYIKAYPKCKGKNRLQCDPVPSNRMGSESLYSFISEFLNTKAKYKILERHSHGVTYKCIDFE